MSPVITSRPKALTKVPTGIVGFDEITRGGLPRGCTTLLVGGSGSGKTVFGLQFLVHGARTYRERGIFVGFEENARRLLTNAEGFDWNLAQLQRKDIYFMDAQQAPDLVKSGDFDFLGMCAALSSKIKETGARRIVVDALDIALALLPDAAARRREVYRLHEWLLAKKLTALITSRDDVEDLKSTVAATEHSFGSLQFMVDCTVILNQSVVEGVSQRKLRVMKYRGSGFDENESPFVIGKGGLEVAGARTLGRVDVNLTNERVSSGVDRLDTMLGGGYYRGASVLITGFPGTAKTTLGGAFAQAACRRHERTMFVSFVSDGTEVIRNLASVGIQLDRYVKSGYLKMISARTIVGSAETFLAHVKALAKEHKTRCIVVDPISSLSRSGNEVTAHGVVQRLIDWSKADGTTLVCTSHLGEVAGEIGSPLQISKLADTWIHLSYLVQAGERNRGLSIIKSRGTAHSNQVRELILSDGGVTLTDAYTAGGEVLMGTLRWEKERADRLANEVSEASGELKRVRLDAETAELEVRAGSLQVEINAKKVEKVFLTRAAQSTKGELSRGLTRLEELRGADSAHPTRK
jgi:circadian clock protein KaiC